jgi:very-short-patch-repair endonuclease
MDPTAGKARILRRNLTDAELRLWQALRYRRFAGHKFRRQQPLGAFIVDFVCLAQRVIIEVDGGHHTEQREYDAARDRWLRKQGFRVLRFTDAEVLTELDSVEQAIWEELEGSPAPQPSPVRGGGSEGSPAPQPSPVRGGGSEETASRSPRVNGSGRLRTTRA